MTNKLFATLTTLSLLAMLLLAATGNSAAQQKKEIDPRRMPPPVKQKVMLPCKAIAKDVATTLYVTNSTNQALPNNQVIYYNTDKNVKGYFKTSNQTATGQARPIR